MDFLFRFVGFSPLLVSSCNDTDGDIRVIHLNDTLDLDAFLNPLALLLCYYVLAISSKFILDAKVTIFESFFLVSLSGCHLILLTFAVVYSTQFYSKCRRCHQLLFPKKKQKTTSFFAFERLPFDNNNPQ